MSVGIFTFLFSLSAVTINEKSENFTITNDFYSVSLNKVAAYALKIDKIGKNAIPSAMAIPVFEIDNDLEKYDGRYNPAPASVSRSKAVCNIQKNSSNEIVLQVSYKFFGGTVTENMTFDNTPVIKYNVNIKHTSCLYAHYFRVFMLPRAKNGIFLPDMQRVQGVWNSNGSALKGHGYRAAWYKSKKIGVGLAAAPQNDLRGIEYSMQGGIKDGWGTSRANINAIFGTLNKYGKSGEKDFNYALILCNSAENMRLNAEKIVGKTPDYELFSYQLKKLAVRPGEGNVIIAEIRNNSTQKTDLILKSRVNYNLDAEKILNEYKLSLAPNERKVFEIPVKFPTDLQKGAAITSELITSDGKIVASATEYCTVTNHSYRDTGFGIINAAQAYQQGSEFTWSRNFKNKYVGNFEYYCWMPSTIFGLAPKENSWRPHTEAKYFSLITKDFLKNLNSEAKKQGVGVYAMITGLWNYKIGIQHPEYLQYAKSGQPLIYNGSMRPDGSRRATLKANMFYPDRAEQWGNEMADSVAMFGWAGCRWDWNFLPNVMSDPFYMGEFTDDWYDYRGVPQSKLFPNPDKTGVECLKAWRAAVAKRHPDFVYGTNYGSSPAEWEKTPLYHKESATNSVVLFEDMLGYSAKKFCTFESWGSELFNRCDLVRRYGASPVVGMMRGLNPGSVSYDLAQYTCAAAGVKWWMGHDLNLLSDEAERNRFLLRFAEYYYNPEFLKSTSNSVKLQKNSRVLWQQFIRERKLKNGREIIMPLINLPEEDNTICRRYDKLNTRQNLTFNVSLLNSEKIDSVWLMTPQNPAKAIKLPVKNRSFSVPELHNTAMVLIRLKGK